MNISGIIAARKLHPVRILRLRIFPSPSAVPPRRTASVRSACASRIRGASRNSIAPPRYAGDFLSRNKAVSGARAYCVPAFVRNPWIVRKSHSVRTPRSEAPHRFAIAAAVVLPSAIAVKISSSTAVFIASVCSISVDRVEETFGRKLLGRRCSSHRTPSVALSVENLDVRVSRNSTPANRHGTIYSKIRASYSTTTSTSPAPTVSPTATPTRPPARPSKPSAHSASSSPQSPPPLAPPPPLHQPPPAHAPPAPALEPSPAAAPPRPHPPHAAPAATADPPPQNHIADPRPTPPHHPKCIDTAAPRPPATSPPAATSARRPSPPAHQPRTPKPQHQQPEGTSTRRFFPPISSHTVTAVIPPAAPPQPICSPAAALRHAPQSPSQKKQTKPQPPPPHLLRNRLLQRRRPRSKQPLQITRIDPRRAKIRIRQESAETARYSS